MHGSQSCNSFTAVTPVRIRLGTPSTPERATATLTATWHSTAPTAPLSERSHPDAPGLDDGEIAGPIFARGYQVGEPPPDIAGPRHRHAQQDDAAAGRQRRSPGQFAEILVEGEKNTLFAGGPCQHVRIACARRDCPHPYDIMPGCLESGDRRAGEILVGEEAHIRLRSGIPSPTSAYRVHRRDTR